MICNGCGRETHHIKIVYQDNQKIECCSECAKLDEVYIPDVYFDKPYFDEHLTDDKHPHGMWINSKIEKGRIMQRLGLREAGDKRHGARREYEGASYGTRKVDTKSY